MLIRLFAWDGIFMGFLRNKWLFNVAQFGKLGHGIPAMIFFNVNVYVACYAYLNTKVHLSENRRKVTRFIYF